MPLYDYRCSNTDCNDVHEERHGMNEKPRIKCPKCGSKCQKDITAGYQVNMGEYRGKTNPNEVQ